MKSTRLIAVLFVGVIAGSLLTPLTASREALAQEKNAKQEWEYKVGFFGVSANDKPEDNQKGLAKIMNENYAASGWEYAGVVASHNSVHGGVTYIAYKKKK